MESSLVEGMQRIACGKEELGGLGRLVQD